MSFKKTFVIILRHLKNSTYYFAISVILYVSYESLFLLIPKLYLSPLLYIIIYIIALFGIYKILHYIYLLGKLKLYTTDLLIELGGIPIKGSSYRCKKCQRYIPTDAYHCSVCDLCVQEHDHHCIFLNRCIGKGNIREFRKFLFSILFCSLLLGICLIRFRFTSLYENYSDVTRMRIYILYLISPTVSIMIIILLATQYEERIEYFYNICKTFRNKL